MLLCCNYDGSDKLPIVFISNSKHPRSFPRNLNNLQFYGSYFSNKKAWMTRVIFLEWLKSFEYRIAKKGDM